MNKRRDSKRLNKRKRDSKQLLKKRLDRSLKSRKDRDKRLLQKKKLVNRLCKKRKLVELQRLRSVKDKRFRMAGKLVVHGLVDPLSDGGQPLVEGQPCVGLLGACS